ncbi:MAG: alpha-methylacyl-CoA racemase [Baekduia sp.]|nr:alpha-methylacyl-CoA racemase [Baekduia sp.]
MAALPLADVRVLDLSRLLPGPFCSLMLADFGADVVKVEDPGAGDYARWAEPLLGGTEPSTDSAFFLALNRNKRSIQLDLKSDAGRDALLGLVDRADVLLESFRPGVLERLGLGYEALLARRPALVICPITGYGQDGPYRARPGHDLNYLASVGLLDLSGEADGAPAQSAAQIADLGGGALMAAFGIMVALRHATATGEGQVVDVSMAHGALSWLSPLAAGALAGVAEPARGDLQLGGGVLCYRPYACADGHVSIGALEPKFWVAFCRGVGREDLVERQFDAPGTPAHAEIEAILLGRTRAQWAEFAGAIDCCLEPAATLAEALAGDVVRGRDGMVVEVRQPGVDRPLEVLGCPLILSATPADVHRRPAPALGEHTGEVLAEAGLVVPTPQETSTP